jgi:tRNA pseudouridine38-40 synthase
MHSKQENNYKLVVKYDGTNYRGWQSQKGENTVQQTVEKALSQIICEKIGVYSSGRTDTGVHALGQTVNFHTHKELIPEKTLLELNNALPEDIRVLEMKKVSPAFHSRHSAIAKTYRYTILRQKKPRYDRRTDVHYFSGPLDIGKMRYAAAFLLGTHDFSSFGNNPGYPVDHKVKTIKKLDIIESDDYIQIEITGSGFLYKMVRSIVGTLIWIGTGKIPANRMPAILDARDRTKAGPVAPASGLCLVEVFYPE